MTTTNLMSGSNASTSTASWPPRACAGNRHHQAGSRLLLVPQLYQRLHSGQYSAELVSWRTNTPFVLRLQTMEVLELEGGGGLSGSAAFYSDSTPPRYMVASVRGHMHVSDAGHLQN
jgi:hypothetical protein